MSTLVIAEIGINHNGSESTAYQLIDAAIYAGADIAKFQLFKPELQGEHLRSVAFTRPQIKLMELYCRHRTIKFACTAFDADSLDWLLKNTDMAFVKISSGQWDNGQLLATAEISKLKVIQSITPDTEYDWRHGWSYLHVIAEYPTKPEHAELEFMVDRGLSGLSDHSGDIFMPLAAVALGAKIIECHITMSKEQEGYDHKASLTPAQFKEMVRGIRAIEEGLQ